MDSSKQGLIPAGPPTRPATKSERNESFMVSPMTSPTKPITAGLIVIGNEILSGKVEEANSRFLAQKLFDMGWFLTEVVIIPDEIEVVVQAIRRLSSQVDHLFTSGGIGPTHDDITLEALAKALDRPLVSSPVLKLLLKKFAEVDFLTPGQERLALVPEGATLHYAPGSSYPQMTIDHIYPLPGIPELFRTKFLELQTLWPVAKPRLRRCFKLIAQETDIADRLGAIAQAHPLVQVGSYPSLIDKAWHIELVLESTEVDAMEKACQDLARVIPCS